MWQIAIMEHPVNGPNIGYATDRKTLLVWMEKQEEQGYVPISITYAGGHDLLGNMSPPALFDAKK